MAVAKDHSVVAIASECGGALRTRGSACALHEQGAYLGGQLGRHWGLCVVRTQTLMMRNVLTFKTKSPIWIFWCNFWESRHGLAWHIHLEIKCLNHVTINKKHCIFINLEKICLKIDQNTIKYFLLYFTFFFRSDRFSFGLTEISSLSDRMSDRFFGFSRCLLLVITWSKIISND